MIEKKKEQKNGSKWLGKGYGKEDGKGVTLTKMLMVN